MMAHEKHSTKQASGSSAAERSGDASDASFSLDDLSRAFAAMFEHEGGAVVGEAIAPEAASAMGEAAAVTAIEVSDRAAVQAMLFVGRPDGGPLSSAEIAGYLRGSAASEVDDLVQQLNADYQANACPYTIVSEGVGYRMTLRPEFEALRDRLLGRMRAARLSPAALEVLALVAYNEPLTSDEISRMRGVPSGHILSHLVRRQLLRVERAGTRPAKARYYTTARFLKLFGLNSRDDLPRSEDLDRQ